SAPRGGATSWHSAQSEGCRSHRSKERAHQARPHARRVPETVARATGRAAHGRRQIERRRGGAHGRRAHAARGKGPRDGANLRDRPDRAEPRSWPAGEARMSMQARGVAVPRETTTLADLLDRVLDKGLVVAGDISVSLANVELLTIRIRLLVCAIDKAEQIGLNWWKYDRTRAGGVSVDATTRSRSSERA